MAKRKKAGAGEGKKDDRYMLKGVTLSREAGEIVAVELETSPLSKQALVERIMQFYGEVPGEFRMLITRQTQPRWHNEAIDVAVAYLTGLKYKNPPKVGPSLAHIRSMSPSRSDRSPESAPATGG